MLSMVGKMHDADDVNEHEQAMRERQRRDFHHEFATMRFVPIKEVGNWIGR